MGMIASTLGLVLVLLMAGCATAPDYKLGWIDSIVTMYGVEVDAECLIDDDYDTLEESYPEVIDRFNPRSPSQAPVIIEEEPQNII